MLWKIYTKTTVSEIEVVKCSKVWSQLEMRKNFLELKFKEIQDEVALICFVFVLIDILSLAFLKQALQKTAHFDYGK